MIPTRKWITSKLWFHGSEGVIGRCLIPVSIFACFIVALGFPSSLSFFTRANPSFFSWRVHQFWLFVKFCSVKANSSSSFSIKERNILRDVSSPLIDPLKWCYFFNKNAKNIKLIKCLFKII